MKHLSSLALLALIITTSCKKTKAKEHTFKVDSATSVAEWKSSTPDHFHIGSFQVKGAVTAASEGTVKQGKLIMNIHY